MADRDYTTHGAKRHRFIQHYRDRKCAASADLSADAAQLQQLTSVVGFKTERVDERFQLGLFVAEKRAEFIG